VSVAVSADGDVEVRFKALGGYARAYL
jgi:hypothetical protein